MNKFVLLAVTAGAVAFSVVGPSGQAMASADTLGDIALIQSMTNALSGSGGSGYSDAVITTVGTSAPELCTAGAIHPAGAPVPQGLFTPANC